MDSKAKQWSVEETNCLLAIWSSAEVQQKIEGASRTKHVFEEIQREMAAAGFNRTIEQINNKLKKLKKDYRDQKKELGRSGNGRPRSRNTHFEVLDSVLGDRPACQVTGALNSTTVMVVDETLLQGIANNVTDSGKLTFSNVSPFCKPTIHFLAVSFTMLLISSGACLSQLASMLLLTIANADTV